MNSGVKLTAFLKPYWRWIALAPLLMTLEVAMNLMQPRLIQTIVDQGIAQLNLHLILQTGLLMVVLTVIGGIAGIIIGSPHSVDFRPHQSSRLKAFLPHDR